MKWKLIDSITITDFLYNHENLTEGDLYRKLMKLNEIRSEKQSYNNELTNDFESFLKKKYPKHIERIVDRKNPDGFYVSVFYNFGFVLYKYAIQSNKHIFEVYYCEQCNDMLNSDIEFILLDNFIHFLINELNMNNLKRFYKKIESKIKLKKEIKKILNKTLI